jgi:hypothetical protein
MGGRTPVSRLEGDSAPLRQGASNLIETQPSWTTRFKAILGLVLLATVVAVAIVATAKLNQVMTN